MYIGNHLLISWVSTVQLLQERRERALVALVGVIPDMDGIGIFIDNFTGTTAFFLKYHHRIGHSLLSGIILVFLAVVLARRQRAIVCLLSACTFSLHMVCDLVGSKGPDGYQWPLYLFYPLNPGYELTWSGQWGLDAWQNQVIMLLAVLLCCFYAVTRQISFLEVASQKFDQAAFQMYRKYVRRSGGTLG